MKTEAERSAKIADTRNYIKDLYYKHFRKKKDGSEFGAFKDAVFSPDVSKAALSPFWNAYAAELTQLLMGLKTTSGLSYDDFDDVASVSILKILAFGKICEMSLSAFCVPVPPKRSPLLWQVGHSSVQGIE